MPSPTPPTLFRSLMPVVYVQVAPDRLVLRHVQSGKVLEEVPEVALSADGKVLLAAGPRAREAAAARGGQVVNPFAHARTLVADFAVAERLLALQLRRLLDGGTWWKRLLAVSPCVVMHPVGGIEGGLTPVERRALHEMAASAGAAQAFVWTGPPLTDAELLARRPLAGHQGTWD